MNPNKALLVLEDGTVFEGKPFAAVGCACGETLFYTGVVGYQEVVTDPSYAGTLTVLTYPIIGSYGVNAEDNETPGVHVTGVIIKEYSRTVSNYRATGKFEDLLLEHGVVGIRDVDTRAIAVHLRRSGEMRGVIVSDGADSQTAMERLGKTKSLWESDLARDLKKPPVPEPSGGEKHRLAALNMGIKRSCLSQLAELGCAVEVLPAHTSAEKVLKTRADGLIVAGGPGDPQVLEYAVDTITALLGKIPVLGVGLGHQILALALGCKIKRMKTGHHGLNYSVKRLGDGRGEITTQHHSFVVDDVSIPKDVEVTHVNVNDRTVEGIASARFPAWSVQYHPTGDDWGRPNRLFSEFLGRLGHQGSPKRG